MAQPTITDGTTIITFNAFTLIDFKFTTEGANIIPIPTLGSALSVAKQNVIDINKKQELYTFHWQLKEGVGAGGTTAWEKLVTLRDTIWKTEHSSNGMHRKVTFTIQGIDVTFFGKIMSIAGPIEAGEDEQEINGILDFAIDNIVDEF